MILGRELMTGMPSPKRQSVF